MACNDISILKSYFRSQAIYLSMKFPGPKSLEMIKILTGRRFGNGTSNRTKPSYRRWGLMSSSLHLKACHRYASFLHPFFPFFLSLFAPLCSLTFSTNYTKHRAQKGNVQNNATLWWDPRIGTHLWT